jgi:hypothetical protein
MDQSSCNPFGPLGFCSIQALRFVDKMLALAPLPHALPERSDRMSNAVTASVHAVVVEIGGTPIRLCSDNASFLDLVRRRYTGFLSSDLHAPVDLTVDLATRTNSLPEDIRVRRDSDLWSAERADFRLEWNSKSKAGRLQLGLNPYSLDAALRILHTLLLAEQGGFLLHAASAVRNGRAFLFFGPSGSGKTTVARVAPRDATLLTDEISYLRQEGEKYLAYGTPFAGELAKSGENISAPITALYQLVKSSKNHLTPMKPGEAVRALLESVLFFAEDANLVKRIFHSVCDLVCHLPVYQLEFVPDQSAWDVVQ